MKTAFEYSLHRGEIFSRSIHFDNHDNLKDISGIQGSVDSSQAAGEGELVGLGVASGNLTASDSANISNSGNTTITMADQGALQAATTIATTAINAETANTNAALKAGNFSLSKALSLMQSALTSNNDLAKQTQAGEINALAKTLGWVAAAVAGIWVIGKIFVAVFSREKKGATP